MSKILLVDDEPKVLRALYAALELDHEVHLSGSVTEAQKAILGSGPFDAVISDEIMPGTKGHELLNWCRANSPTSKRMMLTGLPITEEFKNEIEDIDSVSIFKKPWKIADIERALQLTMTASNSKGFTGVKEDIADARETIVLFNTDARELRYFVKLEQTNLFNIVTCSSLAELIEQSRSHSNAKQLVINLNDSTKRVVTLVPEIKKKYTRAEILIIAPPKIIRELNSERFKPVPFEMLVKPFSLSRLLASLAVVNDQGAEAPT